MATDGPGGSLNAEASTARDAATMVLQRAAQMVGAFLFAALVPRMMGPEEYGRYSLVTSLSVWFALFSGLGFTHAMSRYLPQFVLRGEARQARRFVGGLLTLRLASSGAAAGAYLLLAALCLSDLELPLLLILAGAVLIQSLANFYFGLLLGLGRVARWGLADVVRRWLSLALLLPGFYLGGLRGAGLALLVTELAVLLLGIAWSRWRVTRADLRPALGFLAPYLRFGITFLGSHALFTMLHGSGELMVRLSSGEYAEVSYFGLAHSVYLAAGTAMPQFALAFAPLLSARLDEGRTEGLREIVEHLLKWLTLAAMLAVFGALLLADTLVPVVFGATYRAVAPNLIPLMVALLMLTLSSVTNLLALVFDRPGVALTASGLRLATFWGLGPFLVRWWGSLGGCVAMLAAAALHAGYSTLRMRDLVGSPLKSWGRVVGLGLPFSALLWLRSSWVTNAVLYGAFLAGYGCALLFFGVVTWGELRVALRAMFRGPALERAPGAVRPGWPEPL